MLRANEKIIVVNEKVWWVKKMFFGVKNKFWQIKIVGCKTKYGGVIKFSGIKIIIGGSKQVLDSQQIF